MFFTKYFRSISNSDFFNSDFLNSFFPNSDFSNSDFSNSDFSNSDFSIFFSTGFIIYRLSYFLCFYLLRLSLIKYIISI
ncbi:MAG: hypothetical protein EGR89_03620 [[Eubacterium] rectale]|nr:hypothetical protein [Agathobacter rectalis]